MADETAAEPTEAPAPEPAKADPNAELLALVTKLQSQLNDVTGKLGTYQSKDEADREKKLKDKGDYEKLIKDRDDKLAAQAKTIADRDERFRKTVREREFVQSLGSLGVDLVKGASDQLLALWGGEFEASESEDGSYKVLTKDFKTPAQVLKERLSSPDFEHFVKASSRGQGLRGDGSRPGPSGGQTEGQGDLLSFVKQSISASATGPAFGLHGRASK